MMKTKTKLKRENRKRLKTKTPKQQNLSLNESASIQYGDFLSSDIISRFYHLSVIGFSHKPSSRLPLLSARPEVTFPATEITSSKLCCLVTDVDELATFSFSTHCMQKVK